MMFGFTPNPPAHFQHHSYQFRPAYLSTLVQGQLTAVYELMALEVNIKYERLTLFHDSTYVHNVV